MKLRGTLGKIKRRLLSRHLWFVRSLLLAIVVLLFWATTVFVRNIVAPTQVGGYLGMAKAFLLPSAGVVKQTNGYTNVLLLGVAGDGEKNPFVTDTIMVASIDAKADKVTLISLPRDIWIPDLRDKINGAYSVGNKKSENGGLVLAESVVEEVTGLTIHYALAVDFDGFVEVVDALGGVEVDVARGFTDERFPVPGREDDDCDGDPEYACRYETVSFSEGKTFMNGETALKFARSRHSTDPLEGNDLARAARQQKVLFAIKEALLSPDILLSPAKLLKLWSTFKNITKTDLSDPELMHIVRLFADARKNVRSYVLPEDLLFNPPYSNEYDNLYVFIPKSETRTWEEVHAWVAGVVAD